MSNYKIKNTSNFLFVLLVTFFIFNISNNNLFAQQLSAPKNLTANLFEEAGMSYITLTWDKVSIGEKPDNYNIYMGYSQTEFNLDSIDFGFQQLGTVEEDLTTTTKMTFGPIEVYPGFYGFYVTASKKADLFVESAKSNIEYIFIDEPVIFRVGANNVGYEIKVNEEFELTAFVSGIEDNCDYTIETEFDETKFELLNTKEDLSSKSITFYYKALVRGVHPIDFKAKNLCTNEEAFGRLPIKVGNSNLNIMYFENVGQNPKKLYGSFGQTVTNQFILNKAEGFNCPITYEIEYTSLTNASIDNNGILNFEFNEQNIGEHYISVIAKADNCSFNGEIINVEAVGSFVFYVLDESEKPNSKIYGIITDKETDEPIENAQIIYFNMLDSTLSTYSDFYEYTTGKNGEYEILVKDGVYATYIRAEGYQEYISLISSIDKPFEIKPNEELELNFQLIKLIEPSLVEYKGNVIDEETGKPLANAYVEFIPTVGLEKGAYTNTDSLGYPIEWGFNSYGNFMTVTDEFGNFTINVFDNFKYIAKAVVIDHFDPSNNYNEEFYYETNNMFDAEIINPAEKKLMFFKFTLTNKINQNGNLFGSVVTKDDHNIPATIMAIRVDNNTNSQQNVFNTITRDGSFRFSNIPFGDYILLSIPMTLSHIPGYFVANGGFATLDWNEASIVKLYGTNNNLYHTIVHQSLADMGKDGFASIDGKINKKNNGTKKENIVNAIEPLSGVTVYLSNKNNEILDYKLTDKNGNFNFKNLPEGEYRVNVDKIGYLKNTANHSIKYANGLKQSTTMLMEEDLTSSIEDLESNQNNLLISPNPVNNIAKIEFEDFSNSNANILILDQTGKFVKNLSVNTIKGNNEIDFDAVGLVNGSYIIIVQLNNKVINSKFIINR